MQSNIHVLGIAPYEGIAAVMSRVAEEFPQMDLTLHVGDLEQGVEIAKRNFCGNYDVVISRGGTAKMLRQQLSLPVIEIEVSMYDLLCTLKLADQPDPTVGRTAMVSYDNITRNAQMLCQLMNYNIDILTINSPEEVEPTLQRLKAASYETILCDAVANTTAKRLGLNSFLITSGIESVRRAFEYALQLCGSQERLRDENLFFRQLISGQIGQTVVFDDAGGLFLSTLAESSTELMALLQRELPESRRESERRIVRNLNGMTYSIRSRRITSGRLSLIAFFFVARKTPLSPNQAGIHFSTRPEAENAFYNSIFSFAGTISDFQDDVEKISQSSAPVMVTGEDGTGKQSMVSALYLRGQLRNNPLVTVNCSLLNDKSWTFLLEHHNSPLADEKTTIYFSNIDALSREHGQQLLEALSEMEICRRNRVMFSCVCQPGEYVSEAGALFRDKLNCLSLYLPPLREMSARIPELVRLSISHLNASLPRPILGAEPEATALLQNFRWPHNYAQFRWVMSELTVTASGQIITAEDVRRILGKERHGGAVAFQEENSPAPLDLNRTLQEIERDVALRVLEESGGNQTAAAKRLGISRTTLWRLLKK